VRRAGIYLRTGTTDQNAETQLRELEIVAARSECEIVEVYRDTRVSSGGKGRDKRPAFRPPDQGCEYVQDQHDRYLVRRPPWSQSAGTCRALN